MAWESRSDCRNRYYYIGRRVGERIEKEYVGRGCAGMLAAEAQALAKAEREALQADEALVRYELQRLDAQADQASRTIELLYRATLFASGCYRTSRWEWRRRREPDRSTSES